MKSALLPFRPLVGAFLMFASVSSVFASEEAATARTSFRRCDVVDGHVALTFDDGPHEIFTPELLDTLKQQRVKATFFLVGSNVEKYPEVVKRMVKEGHEVASHSYTHPNLGKMDEGSVVGQLTNTHKAIKTACGVNVSFFRPPYGSFTETQRAWAFSKFGYRTITWDVDPLDWKIRDSRQVEERILASATSGSIVLMHDIHKSTVDAVPQIIQGLRARGLKFATVGRLIALEKARGFAFFGSGGGERMGSMGSGTGNSAVVIPKATLVQPAAR